MTNEEKQRLLKLLSTGNELIVDLWWFIENVNDDDPDHNDKFFALRRRVRDYYELMSE